MRWIIIILEKENTQCVMGAGRLIDIFFHFSASLLIRSFRPSWSVGQSAFLSTKLEKAFPGDSIEVIASEKAISLLSPPHRGSMLIIGQMRE